MSEPDPDVVAHFSTRAEGEVIPGPDPAEEDEGAEHVAEEGHGEDEPGPRD